MKRHEKISFFYMMSVGVCISKLRNDIQQSYALLPKGAKVGPR